LDAKLDEIEREYRRLIQTGEIDKAPLERLKQIGGILGIGPDHVKADKEAWARSKELPPQIPSDAEREAAAVKSQTAWKRWEDRGVELQALTDTIHNQHKQAADEVQRLTELKKSLQKQLAADRKNHPRVFV
jgi:hypothetical protein